MPEPSPRPDDLTAALIAGLRPTIAALTSFQNSDVLAGLREATRMQAQIVANFQQSLAPLLSAHETHIQQTLRQLTQITTQINRDALRAATAALDIIALQQSAVRAALEATPGLEEDNRAEFERILQDATSHLEPSATDIEPDPELTAVINATVADFAGQHPEGLSWEARHKMFVYFWGFIALTLLLQVQLQSKAAKEVLEDLVTAATPVTLIALAASKSWERIMPRDADGEDPGDDR